MDNHARAVTRGVRSFGTRTAWSCVSKRLGARASSPDDSALYHVQLRTTTSHRSLRGRGFWTTDIILALGVNDWLNATLTKTAYGTKLAKPEQTRAPQSGPLTPCPLGLRIQRPNVNGDTLAGLPHAGN